MANRVLVDSSGFKVSRPGVNVLSLPYAGQGVAFNSDWGVSSRIVVQGQQSVSTGTTTVNFGTTLNHIPTVLAMGRAAGNWYRLPFMSYGEEFPEYITYGDGQSTTRSEAQAFMRYQSDLPAYITVYNNRFTYNNAGQSLVNLISYVVLRRQ